MQVRQWTLDLGPRVGAADAQPLGRLAVVLHVAVSDEHPTAFEGV